MPLLLVGLTCTDENFVQKAGAARRAAELGIALVAPDTSPRLARRTGSCPAKTTAMISAAEPGFYVDATYTRGASTTTCTPS